MFGTLQVSSEREE